MQQELDTEAPSTPIHLLGVNSIGAEVGNAEMVDGRVLPWLQDTQEIAAGALWAAEHFDVVILDRWNVPYAVFNLLDNDLADPANYAALKDLLLTAAAQ